MHTESIVHFDTSHTEYSRREIKYYISGFQYKELMKYLPYYMTPDSNAAGRAANSYPIRSLYLESADLKCFNERMDGLKVRSKYRYRAYVEDGCTDETCIFVEIKKKIEKDLYKRRARVRLGSVHEILDNGETGFFTGIEGMSPEEIKAFNNFIYLKHRYKLSPFIGIKYDREAYHDNLARNLRLSFDRNLSARPCPNIYGLFEGMENWKKIDTNGIIFEIKTRSFLPEWLHGLVRRLSLVSESISKYCICVEALGLDRRPAK